MIKSLLSNLISNEFILQSLFSLIFRVLAALSGFILSALIARAFGADQSGYFFLVFSIVNILSVVGCLGLDQSVLFFTGAAVPDKKWGSVKLLLLKSLLITFFITGMLSLSLYFFSDYLAVNVFRDINLRVIMKGMSAAILGLSLTLLVAMSLQGLRRIISSIFFLNILSNFSLVLIILNFPNIKIESFGYLYSIIQFFVFLFSIAYWWFRRPSWPNDHLQNFDWRSVSNHSSSLFLIVVLAQIIQWSGQLISGVWVEPADLARLAMAQRTAMLTSFVLLAINLVVAPRFSSLFQKKDFLGINDLAISSVRLMILLTLPIVLLVLIYPRFIMGLFGEEFILGSDILRILVLGQLVNVFTGPVNNLLIMTGNEVEMKKAMLISGSVIIIFSFILVPIYGVMGGAVATAMAVASQNLISAWYVKRKLSLNIFLSWRF